jgi:hypothetical protein
MKKSIMIGVIFISILLSFTSIVPAVEYNQVIENQENVLDEQLDYISNQLNLITDKLQKNNLIEINDHISSIYDQLIITVENLDPMPSFIFQLLLSLLLAIIGTILGILFGPILAVVILVLVSPAILLAKIIEFIINLINIV